jgi:hypothetical protein
MTEETPFSHLIISGKEGGKDEKGQRVCIENGEGE